MHSTRTTFQAVAAELAAAFETRRIAAGKTFDNLNHPGLPERNFVSIRDNVPEWIRTAGNPAPCIIDAHEAVGRVIPCDWVYTRCRDAADVIAEHDDEDDARDAVAEWASNSPDVYTADLLAWAAVPWAQALADEAAEGLEPGRGEAFSAAVIRWAQGGQALAADRIGAAMLAAVAAEAEARDAAAAGDDATA